MTVITKSPTPTPGLDFAMGSLDWPFAMDVKAIRDAADQVVTCASVLRLCCDEGSREAGYLERTYLREGWRDDTGLGFGASLADCPTPDVHGQASAAPNEALRAVGGIATAAARIEALTSEFDDEVSRFLDDYYLHAGWMRWLAGEPSGGEWREWTDRPRAAPFGL